MKKLFAPFPGRPAVLAALTAAGSWTPSDVFTWARCNGGSTDTYEALHQLTRRGRVTYTRNRWSVP